MPYRIKTIIDGFEYAQKNTEVKVCKKIIIDSTPDLLCYELTLNRDDKKKKNKGKKKTKKLFILNFEQEGPFGSPTQPLWVVVKPNADFTHFKLVTLSEEKARKLSKDVNCIFNKYFDAIDNTHTNNNKLIKNKNGRLQVITTNNDPIEKTHYLQEQMHAQAAPELLAAINRSIYTNSTTIKIGTTRNGRDITFSIPDRTATKTHYVRIIPELYPSA